jgi:hypothetical protein
MLLNPTPDGDSDDEGESCFMFEIGEVVSKSLATDSLVFKIFDNSLMSRITRRCQRDLA